MPHHTTPILRIYGFGTPRVELNGELVVNFETEKTRALLIYLAVESGHPHRREHLAGLFWSDMPEARALQNLRQTILYLRKALREEHSLIPCLVATRESVQLNPDIQSWLDVKAFSDALDHAYQHYRRHIGRGRLNIRSLRQGLAHIQGEFLEQFYLNGSPLFDEWASLQRVEYNRRAVEALSHLAEYHECRGETSLARQAAARLTSLVPWDETAHARLMRLLALDGQWSAAQNQYAILRRYLDEQLGVEPTDSTITLFKQIREAAAHNQPLPSPIQNACHNLPDSLTPFVGRSVELDTLSKMLCDPDCRLLTLLGPGGIGKTRLALEAAFEQVGMFPDGVFFVPLSVVGRASQLASVIAPALGLEFSGSGNPQAEMVSYLRGKELLLVLDNYEHLLPSTSTDPASQDNPGLDILLDILKHAPGVIMLVTSRSPLNLHAESVLELGGLEYPPPAGMIANCAYDALDLFEQSARRVQPRFTLADNTAAVAKICQLLDGNPLAIELSAAWARQHEPTIIAQQIEQDLSFLETRMRDVSERHRSLRAVFLHSWDLLNQAERQVLRQLAVFRGGFTTKAATEVAGGSTAVLRGLIDHSLVRQTGPERYDLHLLVLQFTAEQLAAEPSLAEGAADRHAIYYAGFLSRRLVSLKSAGQQQSLNEIAQELENSRRAWDWLAHHQRTVEIEQSAETLYHFYNIRSRFQEGIDLFTEAVDELEQNPPQPWLKSLAKVLACQGALAFRARKNGLGRAALERARAIFEQLGEDGDLAFCLIFLSGLAQRNKEPVLALEIASRSLALYQQTGDAWGQSYALYLQGLIQNMLGQFPASRQKLIASLAAARAAGDLRRQIAPLNVLGDMACHQGEYDQARRYFEESLAISQTFGDRYNQGMLTLNLGTVSHYEGQHNEARRLYRQSLDICLELGDASGQAMALANLGESAVAEGMHTEAKLLFQQGLEIGRTQEDSWTILTCLTGLGEATLGLEDEAAARIHLSEMLRLALEVQSPLFAVQAMLHLARLHLRQGQVALAEQLLGVVIHNEASELSIRQRAMKLLTEAGLSIPPAAPMSLEQAAAVAPG